MRTDYDLASPIIPPGHLSCGKGLMTAKFFGLVKKLGKDFANDW